MYFTCDIVHFSKAVILLYISQKPVISVMFSHCFTKDKKTMWIKENDIA